jgi:hypothetical protein
VLLNKLKTPNKPVVPHCLYCPTWQWHIAQQLSNMPMGLASLVLPLGLPVESYQNLHHPEAGCTKHCFTTTGLKAIPS